MPQESAAFAEEEVQAALARRLRPSRLAHVERVVHIATVLAELWDVDSEQVLRAAWLHDCARDLPLPEQRVLILPSRWDGAAQLGWHGPAGAVLAWREFGETDAAVLDAIKLHSVPQPDGSTLTKLLFVADKVDPGSDRPLPDAKMLALVCPTPDAGLLHALDLRILDYVARKKPLLLSDVAGRTVLLQRLGYTPAPAD